MTSDLEVDFIIPSTVRSIRQRLLRWYQTHARELPWRSVPTPYRVAVSELMLQQTQIKTVLPYYHRWMERFPDWGSLARAREQTVLKHWEGLGYYSRARNLHRLAKVVLTDYGGELPDDKLSLLKLPGIGPYTAGAILSIAFQKQEPLVDGNVERVLARLFNWHQEIKSKHSQQQLWAWAKQLTPARHPGDFNQALMELGALICTPRNPQCLICPLKTTCQAGEPEKLPVKRAKETMLESASYAVITEANKIWLLQPGSPGRWKDLYRLPEFDEKVMSNGPLLHAFKFAITKYQVSAQLIQTGWNTTAPQTGEYVLIDDLKKLSLPSPHRKALQAAGVIRSHQ
ncbi:MAG: A/G-specific adenine glycosylase [Verrucomicrobiota bacterium]